MYRRNKRSMEKEENIDYYCKEREMMNNKRRTS